MKNKIEDLSSEPATTQNKELVVEGAITEAETAATTQETTMPKTATKKTKPTRRATPKTTRRAKPAHSTARAPVRSGSKLEIVVGLLKRKDGCTAADVLAATKWPAVSMPQMAKSAGLRLRKEKEKGEPTRYFGYST